jgi:UDP-glucose 4-epimerase
MTATYHGRRAVVTGGLGFIGSNLAIALADAGAHVDVIDSSVPGCGANEHNLHGADVHIHRVDIAETAVVGPLVCEADIIFNLAGEISHTDSMKRPERDLQINAAAQLHFLECCSRRSAPPRIVFASTRQVYGIPQALPVDEDHPVEPVDYNGVHKYAAEHYHWLLSRLGRIDALILRLTNVYGPRQALHLPAQGVLGVFLRQALEGQQIRLFGDGLQSRDPIHVDDAVRAFLLAGLAPPPVKERVMNIGSGSPVSLREVAAILSEEAGLPEPQFVPFPEEYKRIDIGDYYSCIDRAREKLGWQPEMALREGLRKALEFYRTRRAEYHLKSA